MICRDVADVGRLEISISRLYSLVSMGSRQPRDANSIKTLRKQLLIAVQSGQPQE